MTVALPLLQKKYLPFFILAAFIALSIFVYEFRIPLSVEADTLSLIPHDEHFTELYFSAYPSLKSSETPGEKTLSFSYTIHNVQGADTIYAYRVYLMAPAGQTYPIANGTKTIQNDAADRVIVEYTIPQSFETRDATVIVELPDRGQRIDFPLSSNPV